VRDSVEAADSVEAEESAGIDGFEAFYEANHSSLFGTLCLVTGSTAEAEELMQETFLKIWERWDRVKEHPDPPGYLYRTAFNLHRSRGRRSWRMVRNLLPLPRSDEDLLASLEERDVLYRALLRLSRRQRTAVVLTELLDMTSEESARVMGVRPVTVRVLASQGRAALKAKLEERDG
jgi:RNA polymerase sigma-70 factor (ECF subfamily)